MISDPETPEEFLPSGVSEKPARRQRTAGRRKPKTLENAAQVYECALGLLGYRDYSDRGMKEKLQRRGAAPEQAASAVDKLKQYGLLDERRYAMRLYEVWLGKRCYGRLHLQAELAKKAVRAEVAQEILQLLTPELEAERAEAAASYYLLHNKAKIAAAEQSGDRAGKQKIYAAAARFLAAHGFSARYMYKIAEKLAFSADI